MSRAPFHVTVHHFRSRSSAYESGSTSARNALVFIGGLGDGPHTVCYIRSIARRLESETSSGELSYSVFEFRMSSAYGGFGYKRLSDDVADISALVKYLRGLGREKIVLLGHSTGCQDCMEYTDYARYGSPPVDGFILQGPVSDREAFGPLVSKEQLDRSLALASELIKSGKEDAIMPRDQLPDSFGTPITAYRWHSLISPGGDDDFFSSDLPDEKVASSWGKFQKPVLILPSGEDEHVPKSIDVEKLISRWRALAPPGITSDLSGPIPGANHTVDSEDAQAWMCDRVVRFLKTLG